MKNPKKSKPNSRRRFSGGVAASVLISWGGAGSIELVEAGAIARFENNLKFTTPRPGA